jgi:hypothetical protein
MKANRPKKAQQKPGDVIVKENGHKKLVVLHQSGQIRRISIAKHRKGCGKVKRICIKCVKNYTQDDSKHCVECSNSGSVS